MYYRYVTVKLTQRERSKEAVEDAEKSEAGEKDKDSIPFTEVVATGEYYVLVTGHRYRNNFTTNTWLQR